MRVRFRVRVKVRVGVMVRVRVTRPALFLSTPPTPPTLPYHD